MRAFFILMFLVGCWGDVRADMLCGSHWDYGTFYIENHLDTSWQVFFDDYQGLKPMAAKSRVFYFEPHGGAPSFVKISVKSKNPEIPTAKMEWIWVSGKDTAISLDAVRLIDDSLIVISNGIPTSKLPLLGFIADERIRHEESEKRGQIYFFIVPVIALTVFILLRVRRRR